MHTADENANNIANYTQDTAKAFQTILQINNATAEDQAQQIANLTIQNQDLHA